MVAANVFMLSWTRCSSASIEPELSITQRMSTGRTASAAVTASAAHSAASVLSMMAASTSSSSSSPPPPPRAKEEAVVQAFTDMAGIERLAAALFAAQERTTADPTLGAIFRSFVGDEARHAVVAARLARYYDVHRYRAYRQSPALVA